MGDSTRHVEVEVESVAVAVISAVPIPVVVVLAAAARPAVLPVARTPHATQATSTTVPPCRSLLEHVHSRAA